MSDLTPVGHCDSTDVADTHADRETTTASRITTTAANRLCEYRANTGALRVVLLRVTAAARGSPALPQPAAAKKYVGLL